LGLCQRNADRQSIRVEAVAVIELQRRVLRRLAQKVIAGSPRTLKLVLTSTGQPVFALNADNSAWQRGELCAEVGDGLLG
jgi:hypothetical protein